MARKTERPFDDHIIETTLEDVMHNAYITYAEYVILERALPRVEDGLKPVQRRILYTMHGLGLTPDKPFKKCARIVGEALGKYHPHGDSSVYDALVRLAQDFSLRAPLAEGHGNFGSADGDSAAAMRYTEARMSPFALEMLRDLDKDTVPFRPNFDDSEIEPDLLPAAYPNLLVNGSSGIAVGLATNIPPHNLSEVIDATVLRIRKPDCTLDDVMRVLPGPDFPTGGVLEVTEALREAYETGKGKVKLRAKVEIEEQKNGKTLLVITEIPYELKKAALLERVLAVSEEKKELFSFIDDIRDESDREGMRAVIGLKRGCDPQKALALLYKYTDLSVTVGFNVMAIAEGSPKQLGLLSILDYYIAHRVDVVERRTRYDLQNAEKREHILAGLIVAVENIDEVVRLIRSSKDVKEAKQRLMQRFDLTGVQAQAILDMRLARLTNLEIDTLRAEYDRVCKLIAGLRAILASRAKLMQVIEKELLAIRKSHPMPRKTLLASPGSAPVVDEAELRVVEDCVILKSNGSHLRRVAPRALQKGAETDLKNEPLCLIETDTDARLKLFTNKGNMYTLPASAVPEGRLKDAGKSLGALIAGTEKGEEIVALFAANALSGTLVFFTRQGMVKQVAASEFDVRKTRIAACGLKEDDELLCVFPAQAGAGVLLVTAGGMSIHFKLNEVSQMGRIAKGVCGVKLSSGDTVVMAALTRPDGAGILTVITGEGFAKRTPLAEYDMQGRGGKGLKTYALRKGERLAAAVYSEGPCSLRIAQALGDVTGVSTDDILLAPRNAGGEQVVLALMNNAVVRADKRIFG